MRRLIILVTMGLLLACSTTVPGRRCLQWTSAEWLELEQRFAESWACHEGTDESAILLDLERFDFFCQDEALDTYCYDEEENLVDSFPGYQPASCDPFKPLLVTGRYHHAEKIVLSTRYSPMHEPFTVWESSGGHEMIHRRLALEYPGSGGDATHEKAPGPWTRGHTELDEKLKKGQTVCE